jgi:hypothetical protein
VRSSKAWVDFDLKHNLGTVLIFRLVECALHSKTMMLVPASAGMKPGMRAIQ